MNGQEMEEEADAPPAPKRSRMLLFGVVFCGLLAIGGGAAWYLGLLGGQPDEADDVPALKNPIYYTLDSNLVVNFRDPGRVRYLQVGIDLMTRDAKVVAALNQHSPVLRNELVMLLSDHSVEELSTREGKERLQQQALEAVQAVLEQKYGSAGVEAVYFTTFVMQ